MNTDINNAPFTIVIVEDEPHTLNRLAGIVGSHPDLNLVGTSTTFMDGLELLLNNVPDILLTDLGLPDGSGIDLIREISHRHLKTLAMVITVFGDETHVIDAMKAGASGYLLKDSDPSDITYSISQMIKGGAPMSPGIAGYLLKYFRDEVAPKDSEPAKARLTEAERAILQMVSKGYTSKEIAEINHLSYYTVTTHIKNIYQKLSINSRAEAVMEAIRLGLVKGDRD
jgi:DNA-binding NarL/FixJ family response regulator